MTALASCLYVGEVVHQRMRPRRHRLNYRVFSLMLDLDELAVLDRRLRWWSLDRFNLFSFCTRDHGDGTGGLRAWIERHLDAAGIDLGGGAIRLLCYPRILGYVFNPLSVYYCYRAGGGVAAVLYEVSNTFGERHSYLLPVAGEGRLHHQGHECNKVFYVSPFIAMTARYRFRIDDPGEQVRLVINESDAEGPLLYAVFHGVRRRLSDRALIGAFIRYPLMTLKVIGGIHWEALRLWLKGVPLVDRPPPPDHPVTIVNPVAS